MTLVAAANALSSSSSSALTSNSNRHPFDNLSYLRLAETGFPLPDQERSFLPQFRSYDPEKLWAYFLQNGLHSGNRLTQWQMTVWKRECRPALFQGGGIAPGGGPAGNTTSNSYVLSRTCDRCAVYGIPCVRSPVTFDIAAARNTAAARGIDGSTLGCVAAAPFPRNAAAYAGSSVTSAGRAADGVALANVPAGAGLAAENNGFRGNLWANGRQGPRTVMLRNAAVPVMQGAGRDPVTGQVYSDDPFAADRPTLCCDGCFAAGGRSAARCSLFVHSPDSVVQRFEALTAGEFPGDMESWFVDMSPPPRPTSSKLRAMPRYSPRCLDCLCEDMAEGFGSEEKKKNGRNLCISAEDDIKCRRCRERGRDCVFGRELVDLNAKLGDVVPALGAGPCVGSGGGGGGGGDFNLNLNINSNSNFSPQHWNQANGFAQPSIASNNNTSNNVPASQATHPQHHNVAVPTQQVVPRATTTSVASNNSNNNNNINDNIDNTSSDTYTTALFQPPSSLSTTTATSSYVPPQQAPEPVLDYTTSILGPPFLDIIAPSASVPDTTTDATNTTDVAPAPAPITTRKKCEGCEHASTPGYKGKRSHRSCDTDLVNGRGCKQCVTYGLVCVLDGYVLPRHRDAKSHVGFTPCNSCKDAARAEGPAGGTHDTRNNAAIGPVERATLLCDRKQACDRCCLTNSYCHRSVENSARIVGIIGRDKPGADLEGFYLNAGKAQGQPGVLHPDYGTGKGKKHWVMPMDYHFQYLDKLGVPRPASADDIVELPGREGGVPLWLKKVRKVMEQRAAVAAAAVAGPPPTTVGTSATTATSSGDAFAQDLGISQDEEDIVMGEDNSLPVDAATTASYLTSAETGYDDFEEGAFFNEAFYRMSQHANDAPDLNMWYGGGDE